MKKTTRALQLLQLIAATILATALPASSLTIPPTLRDEITGRQIADGTRNLVICIHGWNPFGKADKYTEGEWDWLTYNMKQALPGSSSDSWALLLYHWEADANTGLIDFDGGTLSGPIANANQAANLAWEHGISLGARLPSSLRKVHIIAHSAGAWCAYQTASALLANPYTVVQVTLLDPYIPDEVPGLHGSYPTLSKATIDGMANWPSGFSTRFSLLENYFADDSTPGIPNIPYDPLAIIPTLGTQTTFSWRAQDINLRVDWSFTAYPYRTQTGADIYYDWHSGPVLFYGDTIEAANGGTIEPGLPSGGLPFDYNLNGWKRGLFYRFQSGLMTRFTAQPQRTTSVASGTSVTLSVGATSLLPFTFQWFKRGQDAAISGATFSYYTFTASSAAAGDYVVRLLDSGGNVVFSDFATVDVTDAPPPAAAPSIASVSPSTLPPSYSTQLIKIYGSNFMAGGDPNASTLIFRDPTNTAYVRTPVFVSSSQLQYNITVQSAVGTWSVTVTNAGQAASNLKTFLVATPPPNTGSLTVNLFPTGAVSAGAQWQVDGGSYRNSGDTATGLAPGSHNVSFKSVSGYTTPAGHSVSISSGANTTDSGTYTVVTPSTCTLTLNYNPAQGGASPSPLVPQTGSTYGSYSYGYTAGASTLVQASASSGYHFTGWSGDASGTATPITVTMNGNKNITANFAAGDPNLGTLTVTIVPPEAAAAGVTWGFNENDFHASGSSLILSPMSTLIFVHNVSGWTGGSVYPVTIVAGQTTNCVFAVSSTTGSTVGNDPRTYCTLAGLAGSSGSTDGTNSAARFSSPWHVAVDTAGNMYVADYGNNTVRKITPAGAVSTLAGLAGSPGRAEGAGSTARFNMPVGVAVDTNGNVYVGDYGNSTIRKITPGGVVSTLAGLAGNTGSAEGTGSAARFKNPNGVAVDSNGNVYVADYGNYTIRKITPGGAVSTLAGLAGNRGTADGVGAAARFFYPAGIAVDNAGSLYVADTFNHTIRKITSDGTVTTLAGFPGSGGAADGTGSVARFSSPNEVAVDSSGNVYVADGGNSIIRKVTPAGVASTLAGLSGNYGSTDGNGNTVRFQFAHGVAVDRAGTLFVADTGNSTIRTTMPVGTKFDQTITFAAVPDKYVNDLPFALSATASSGLPVTLSLISGPATLSNNAVTLTGAGTVTVRASQVGDSTFNAATNVDRSFVVAKLPQTITFGALSRQVVGDAPFALSASASSGLVVSFSLLSGPAVLSGNVVTITGPGLVVLRASQPGDSIYASAADVDQVLIVVPGNNVVAECQRLGNGMFKLRYYGDTGTNYVVVASTNLVNWLPVTTNQVGGLGYLEFIDMSSTNFNRRFYRVGRQ